VRESQFVKDPRLKASQNEIPLHKGLLYWPAPVLGKFQTNSL